MRLNALLSTLLITGLLATQCVYAAQWPDNWLGPADTEYVHLRLGVFYYGAVLDDLPGEAGGDSPLPLHGSRPDGTALPDSTKLWMQELTFLEEQSPQTQQAEFERTMAELQENARFYWRNSRFNCAITFKNVETSFSPHLRSELLNNDPPYNGPVGHPKYGDAREEYDGLLHICVLYKYNAESGKLERVRGGGGWTWGCALKDEETGKKLCGWSWWNAPPAWHDCGNDWLFCHEFGHQLDSLFHESGHPEHWFNHLARLEGNVARFGEHFDAMSYILRRTPEADWTGMFWGEQRSYADADSDGMPDADAWLNALGLESDPDPSLPDADSDGLSDREEALAMNGNRNGHGERLHPALAFVSQVDPDSDQDSLLDGSDALPQLAMADFVPGVGSAVAVDWPAPALDVGTSIGPAPPVFSVCKLSIPAAESAPPLSFVLSFEPDDALVIDVLWGYAALEAPETELRIMLDLENDGWFNGDDNYRFTLDSTGIAYAAIHRAGSYTEWPVEDRERVDKAACGFEWIKPSGFPWNDEHSSQYQHAARLRLDKAHFPAFQGKAGERIGVNIGVRNTGTRWFYMFGEPNTLVPLELR